MLKEYLFSHLSAKFFKAAFLGSLVRYVIDQSYIGGKFFFVFPDQPSTGIPYLVYGICLDLRLRKDVFDGLCKTVQVVGGRNQYILSAT